MRPIYEIAKRLGVPARWVEPYGLYKAKISLEGCARLRSRARRRGRLVNVTAITPTSAGEGKTCTAIGLTQALGRLGSRVVLCLREPSLGPLLGVKGGATGAGRAQVVPAEEINLHFTGDLHAITTAHNFLAAVVDNHIVQGNRLGLDPVRETLRRAIDIPDRSLRHIVTGIGGKANGIPRESGFDITAASEIMAVVALARHLDDLQARLGRMIVAYTTAGKPVTAKALNIVGALSVILKDAIKPNLVQTLEGQPTFVHAGPFANVSHGNSSVIATDLGLRLSDIVITESGFGTDLGTEKFCDIVCPQAGFAPDAIVLVVSVRALKMHGGAEGGLANLRWHLQIVQRFGLTSVVAINRFPGDTPAELRVIQRCCRQLQVPCAISEVVARGGSGGTALARLLLATLRRRRAKKFSPLYRSGDSLEDKLQTIAREIYGADGVKWDRLAEEDLRRLTQQGFGHLPVNVAKTHLSLSDEPSLKGAPTGWKLRVRELRVSAGAGFVVALCGKTTFMPGLPKHPLAEQLRLSRAGKVVGLE
ncbi:MAG: formate--tetrahydrofolate ligase [Candidatus Omnitrophica bacterium]|nr:formate--tetrahydrofolate ligase [Candidatus Omnitrophota bacterium]